MLCWININSFDSDLQNFIHTRQKIGVQTLYSAFTSVCSRREGKRRNSCGCKSVGFIKNLHISLALPYKETLGD